MAPCWNGHREAHATSAQNAHNIMYTNIHICGMDGRGWGGVGVGLPMVSRVSL